MKNTSAADMWASYQRDVIPATAGPTQVTESRRAFYAGGFAVLKHMLGEVAALPDAQAMKAVDRLYAEMLQFGVDVGQGKA
jgi:hypothetical protein